MSAPTPKPTALAVIPENIPAELTTLDRWVVWRWTWKADKGKWDKPPFNAKTGRLASSTDSATWSSFATASATYQQDQWDGIGVVLVADDDFMGVDLDYSSTATGSTPRSCATCASSTPTPRGRPQAQACV